MNSSKISTDFNGSTLPITTNIGDRIKDFYFRFTPLIAASFQAITSLLFFLTINYPNLFSSIVFFRQRWFGLAILVISLIFTSIFTFYNNKQWTRLTSFSVLSNSIILFFFCITYYLRLFNATIVIFGQEISTGIIFIPLTLLIFLVNYQLFDQNSTRKYLLISQTLLYLITTYSLIFFIGFDNTQDRSFVQDWLQTFFSVPDWIWLVVTSMVISFVTIRSTVLGMKDKVIFWVVISIIMVQIVAGIHFIPLRYWYQTLLALISWNFILNHLIPVLEKKTDAQYTARLTISSIYHAILFILVLTLG